MTPIEKALNAIVDGEPVPWSDLELPGRLAPADLESLHLLDDVARAFRQNDAASAPRPAPLFRWGTLEVEQRIGSGAFGEVWRAFDPWLGRTVALKLRSGADSAMRNGEQLEEARRLARIRHPNVLSCYGAAVHDGRAGLWSELIDGRSLRQVLADDGALSAEETLRVGRDLARALAAVHGAGLVHGDIKAENVMRERGGRIVLMDFGAGGEERLLASRRLIAGTPAYLAPEVRDGAPQSVQSDLYALGVLLFQLLTNHLPDREAGIDPASNARLAALTPDLDPRAAAVIRRCLDPDPSQRPRDAAELAASLSDGSRADRAPHLRYRVPVIAVCLLAAAAVTALMWPRLFMPAWDADATFLRTRGGNTVTLARDAGVAAGDRLRLKLIGNRPMHVYVLNEDADGRATVLYPLADGASALDARGETILPGGKRDAGLAWEVDGKSTREEFVVIAALAPIATLENDIAGWQRSAADRATRSAGMLIGDGGVVLQGTHLREILAGLPQGDAVRTWRYAFTQEQP